MTEMLLIGFVLILVFGITLTLYERISAKATHADFGWACSDNMPHELRQATLVMSERSIETDYPIALHGTPDQVFKTQRGDNIPVDTKTRRQVVTYDSDQLQLSVYAMILRHRFRLTMASYGYIRVVLPNGRTTYCRVKLLDDRAVIKASAKLSGRRVLGGR